MPPSFISSSTLSLSPPHSSPPSPSTTTTELHHLRLHQELSLISMAVEARHLNLFPPQLLPNRSVAVDQSFREMIRPIEMNGGIPSPYGFQNMYGLPLSETTTVDTAAALLPMYNSSPLTDSLPPKTPLKSDSCLTYNMPVLSRKRSRDSPCGQILPYAVPQRDRSCGSSFSFLGEDISLQIQQQQLDVNRLIAQHMEKVRMEIEEKRKNQARRILEVVEERLVKRLRSKEEEIDKIAKMNWALEERIKSLCVENQIWRDLAQTNEATANALRTNLEQVLAHVKDDDGGNAINNNNHHDLADDAQSCCDSSGPGDDRGAVTGPAQDGGAEARAARDDRRWCRNCRREEARVLLLPCRHLCLCTVCGSSLHTCPVCNSAKTASVHVNVS